ncbi:MAG TPA: hypothetical protein VM658_03715 [bacterium]|nr:hypothetical protein [bacterium]
MEREQVEKDLQFIKQTMEASTRYTNLPPLGYLLAGVCGLAGPGLTWLIIGADKAADPRLFTGWDVALLAVLWILILAAAAGGSVYLSLARAEKLGVSALTPPARRMFSSQFPLLGAVGVLTLGLFATRDFGLIPALWLLSYGLVLFGFHYYTGKDHLLQSLIFLALGAVAAFSSGRTALVLMALGFGAVNLAFGVKNLIADKELT